MPYCEVADQVELYYEDFGEGPPIVFTNAGNLTHKMWMGQVAALAPEFRTITYDIRGTGFSSKPRDNYSAEAAAADLCSLIDKLAIPPVTLAAHGIGTHILLLAADMRPDLVTGIVLVSGAPWFRGERNGVTAGVANEFLAFLEDRSVRGVPYAEMCEEMIGTWLFHKAPAAGVGHAVLEQALTWPQFVLNSFSKNMRDIDHRDRLSRLICPAMVVHGRHDRKQLYAGAVEATRLLRNARLTTLEESAHMGQIEELNTFNHVLSKFCREIGRCSG
jgi:pimeloyl-ACP methyl ester carboxylesterase